MIYVPVIYFLILFIIICRKNGFDMSAYITLLYVITSFFSVLILKNNYKPYANYDLSVIPTFLYCFLITLAILPIYIFNIGKIKKISFHSSKLANYLTYFYFGAFIVTLIAYGKDILLIFFLGDFAQLRNTIYRGGDLDFTTDFPVYIRYLLIFVNVFSSISYVMLFLYFYNIAYRKKHWWFNLMTIVGSTTCILYGIMNIDRSKTFYWIILLGLSATMFWKHINRRIKCRILPVIIILLGSALLYMTILTRSRFENQNGGSNAGLITYAGQSYLNFCYFWDSYDNGEILSTKYLFPATHYWIIKDYKGAVPLQQQMTLKTGMDTGVFYSYLGSFLVDSNHFGPFLITIAYLFLSAIVYRREKSIVSFGYLLAVFFLAIIPTCGCISYIYTDFYKTISVVVILLAVYLIKEKYTVQHTAI